MKIISTAVSDFIYATLDHTALTAADPEDSIGVITPTLPSHIAEFSEASIKANNLGFHLERWQHVVARLGEGAEVLDTSYATHVWSPSIVEYDDGRKAVALEIFSRAIIHYKDGEGVERVLPIARWYELNSASIDETAKSGRWGSALGVNYADFGKTCGMYTDAVLTGAPLDDSDEAAHGQEYLEVFTTPGPDEYMSGGDFGELFKDITPADPPSVEECVSDTE